MERERLYRIGEFSKISGLSVRTLRYYDEISLLKPDVVDNFTDYRYYTDKNLYEAYIIGVLKSVNFSLEEIINTKGILTNQIIEDKVNQIENEIFDLQQKIERLNEIKNSLTETGTLDQEKGKVLYLGTDNVAA